MYSIKQNLKRFSATAVPMLKHFVFQSLNMLEYKLENLLEFCGSVSLHMCFLCSRSSSRPPYYPREADSPPKHVREVHRVEHHESKCTHVCSRRGEPGSERSIWVKSNESSSSRSCCVTGLTLVSVSSQLSPSLCGYWTDRFSAVYRLHFSQLRL